MHDTAAGGPWVSCCPSAGRAAILLSSFHIPPPDRPFNLSEQRRVGFGGCNRTLTPGSPPAPYPPGTGTWHEDDAQALAVQRWPSRTHPINRSPPCVQSRETRRERAAVSSGSDRASLD